MEQKISEIIKQAEMVLIGIGGELSPKFEQEEGTDPELALFYRSRFYRNLPDDREEIQAYNRLRDLVGAKPYFVVTMNTDDLIYRSRLEKDLIVAPCGSMGKMQCAEHIVDAEPVCETVFQTGNPAGAVCPICQKPLQFHTVHQEGYLEQGYLPQWEAYTKWLQCTLNRRLCILELGVGFAYPQVIRWPFEKIAACNRKATLIRVNSRFPQLDEKLAGKGISVAQSPLQFLKEC